MVAARELHPALLLFKQVLSCVSYAAFRKNGERQSRFERARDPVLPDEMVVLLGNAPGSSAYQADALLLSYRTSQSGGMRRACSPSSVKAPSVFKTAPARLSGSHPGKIWRNAEDLHPIQLRFGRIGFQPIPVRLSGSRSMMAGRGGNAPQACLQAQTVFETVPARLSGSRPLVVFWILEARCWMLVLLEIGRYW